MTSKLKIKKRVSGYLCLKWHHCRIVRVFGKVMYTLLYLKWITNRDLLDSTWNSAECCASLDGRGVGGWMDACICMAKTLHCSPETTTLLIGYTTIQNVFGVIKNKLTSLYIHTMTTIDMYKTQNNQVLGSFINIWRHLYLRLYNSNTDFLYPV